MFFCKRMIHLIRCKVNIFLGVTYILIDKEVIAMYSYPRLRDTREDADKTQKQIGFLLQTTQQQYAKYEKGIQEIPAHHLLTLAKFYSTSTDYLLGLTNNPKPYTDLKK